MTRAETKKRDARVMKYLATEGATAKKAAERFGVSYHTIVNIKQKNRSQNGLVVQVTDSRAQDKLSMIATIANSKIFSKETIASAVKDVLAYE